MSKIAYLFGAGASFGTIPLVKDMPEWIDKLIQDLKNLGMSLSKSEFFEKPESIRNKSKLEHQIDMINDLVWLRDASATHISIDTYAKKLAIKKDSRNLDRLKIILSVYFVIEQTRKRPNNRYDYFFASILESPTEFPEDIRILSWNYDSQFEIAYSEFSNNPDIFHNRRLLNVHIKNKKIEPSELGTFGIYKLNGSTELFPPYPNPTSSNSYFFNPTAEHKLDLNKLETIVRMYAIAKNQPDLISGLSFAWVPSNWENFMDKLKEDTKNTEVLIVIGYSFPYFNRSVDREIIRNMKGLKKVHFQDPDADSLMVRFKSIRDDYNSLDFIPEEDQRYFTIPDELSK